MPWSQNIVNCEAYVAVQTADNHRTNNLAHHSIFLRWPRCLYVPAAPALFILSYCIHLAEWSLAPFAETLSGLNYSWHVKGHHSVALIHRDSSFTGGNTGKKWPACGLPYRLPNGDVHTRRGFQWSEAPQLFTQNQHLFWLDGVNKDVLCRTCPHCLPEASSWFLAPSPADTHTHNQTPQWPIFSALHRLAVNEVHKEMQRAANMTGQQLLWVRMVFLKEKLSQ